MLMLDDKRIHFKENTKGTEKNLNYLTSLF